MRARVAAVMRKELRDYRRNKLVVGTLVALPIVFFVFPLIGVLSLSATSPLRGVRAAVESESLTLLLLPLILPTVLAGYTVVGEREQGTLEPVLTTPVREEELLLGKALAAAVPTVVGAYLLYALYLVVVRLVAAHAVVTLVWKPAQILAYALFAPLLATFSIWVGLAISIRSTDVRVAQQLSTLSVLPMVGLIALFSFRVISPTITVALIGAAILATLDLGAWRVVSRLFDRERVLTRYGRG